MEDRQGLRITTWNGKSVRLLNHLRAVLIDGSEWNQVRLQLQLRLLLLQYFNVNSNRA